MNRNNQDFHMITPLPWQPQQHQEQHVPNVNLAQQPDDSKWAMTGITYPGKHDVMLGRGGESNYHTGNLTFRNFIQEHKKRYQKARKQEKPIIALEVVLAWRELDPPGRFLARIDPSRADSLWEDVGDDMACKRAGRTLGEKSVSKSSLKQKQDQQESSHDDKQPNSAVSADEAFSAEPTTTTSKLPSRPAKRSQVSIDFIDSFRSRQMACKSEEDDTCSPPPTKKRRSLASMSKRDFIRQATANLMIGQHTNTPKDQVSKSMVSRSLILGASSNLMKTTTSCSSTKNLVTPDMPGNKVMDHCKVPLDIGTILDDDQREQAHSLRESIPTAEFLTRTVFVDW